MDDYNELPLLTSSESVKMISTSSASKAQKLLCASLITQSRVFEYKLSDDAQSLLILDVTHFLNHRINTKLMQTIGAELAHQIAPFTPELILTAPSSGNIPAISTAMNLKNTPDVLYAPKGTPITMTEIYQSRSRSYTHGKSVDLTVAKDCLPSNTTVAICDDFLDTGRTGLDLLHIVTEAKSKVSCFFFVIEKPYGGRENLQSAGFADEQIISLVKIDSLRPGKLKINGFDAWFELMRK